MSAALDTEILAILRARAGRGRVTAAGIQSHATGRVAAMPLRYLRHYLASMAYRGLLVRGRRIGGTIPTWGVAP